MKVVTDPKLSKKAKSPEQVKFERISWDEWYYNDITNGNGFTITQSAAVTLDGKITKSQYGTNSPKYGTSYEDEQAFMERHRCECGEFKGKQFETEICPFCGTEVMERPINIKMTGWFSLGEENVIINPHWYKIFQKLMGDKAFTQMISPLERVDKNGNRHQAIANVDYSPASPYDMIGIDGFFERYEEILDYFGRVKKKPEEARWCKKNKYKAFTSHIPVYSTVLRPSSATSDTLYYNGIEKDIHPLFNLTESIRTCEPIEKAAIQDRIQKRVQNIWEYNFQQINKKEGFIRNKLISGALNYTSRCVITSDILLKTDEVGLPYQAFRVLFKNRIIYWLRVLDDCTLAQAYLRWQKSLRYDEHVYNVMKRIIEIEKPMILLNRNPTINLYSLLRMKVKYVKKPERRATLSIPNTILEGLNADYDGDILNIIALVTPAIQKMFKKFDPVRRYMISRTTGKLDPSYGLSSTDLTNIYSFATMEFPDADGDDVPDDKLDEIFLPYIQQMVAKRDKGLQYKIPKIGPDHFPKVKLPENIMM